MCTHGLVYDINLSSPLPPPSLLTATCSDCSEKPVMKNLRFGCDNKVCRYVNMRMLAWSANA